MTRAQFIFSLGSGAGLLALGAALASSGVGDWGLFWVGGIVSIVTLASVGKLSPAPAMTPIPQALPLTARLEG